MQLMRRFSKKFWTIAIKAPCEMRILDEKSMFVSRPIAALFLPSILVFSLFIVPCVRLGVAVVQIHFGRDIPEFRVFWLSVQ